MPRRKTLWTEAVQVRLSPDLKAMAVTAAEDAGMELATWIRSVLAEKVGWASERERKRLAASSEDGSESSF